MRNCDRVQSCLIDGPHRCMYNLQFQLCPGRMPLLPSGGGGVGGRGGEGFETGSTGFNLHYKSVKLHICMFT